MEKKKRSPIMIIGFAVLIGFLAIALLNGTIRPSSFVFCYKTTKRHIKIELPR